MSFQIGVYEDQYPVQVNSEDGWYESVRSIFYIAAGHINGRNFFLADYGADDRPTAESFLKTVDHDPFSKPDAWVETDPVYGSEAWDSNAEYDLACFEADAYNEPRPDWF